MESIELLRILDEITALKREIKTLSYNPIPDCYYSSPINEIAAALSQARLKFEEIGVNKKNVDGYYPDLSYILSKVNNALAKEGISFYQYTHIEDTSTILITKLIHSSGQWISSRIILILGDTDKGNERTIQINKRSQALAILGIWPNEDLLDDGGDQEMEQKIVKGISSPYEKPSGKRVKEVITKEQYDHVIYELEGYPGIAEGIKEKYNITTLKDMPKEYFIQDMERIRKLKLEMAAR